MALTVGGVAIDLTANAAQVITEMNKAARAVTVASTQMQGSLSKWQSGFTRAERGINGSLNRIGSGLRQLRGLALSFGAGLGAREIIRYGDAWKLASAQLRLVTGSSEEAAAAQAKLFSVAQNLGVGVDALNTIYVRTSRNAESLGVSQQGILDATEALGAAIRISGTSAVEANAALIQLSQSFASGALRGDELRSVAEQMPVVLDAIATATGNTRQEVITFARENGIAADLVIQSLIRQRDAWVAQADTVGGTVEQAMTRVQNAIQQVAGRAGEAGAFQPLVDGLNIFADYLQSTELLAALTGFGSQISTFAATSRNEFVRLGAVISAVMEGHFGDAMDIATGRMREFEESITSVTRAQAQALGVPYLNPETFGPPAPTAAVGAPLVLRGAPSIGAAGGSPAAAARPSGPFSVAAFQAPAPFDPSFRFQRPETFGPPNPGAGFLAEEQNGLAMTAANEKLIAQYTQINAAAQTFSQTVSEGFTKAITQASSFGEALKGIIEALAAAVIQAIILQAVTAAVGAPGAGGLLGSIFTAPAPGRAHGGPVAAGGLYRVGNEYFAPAMAGSMLTQSQARGMGGEGGGTSVTNIYADQIDPGTVSRILNIARAQVPGAMVNARSRGRVRDRAPF